MILKAKRTAWIGGSPFYEIELPKNFDVYVPADELGSFLQWSERTRSRWLATVPESFIRRGPGGREPKVELYSMIEQIYSRFRRVTGGDHRMI